MTPLERALRGRIAAEGPITVEAYMDACNAYYYATRDPLGAGGDFTTAPEISQMFGELIGAALTDVWRRAGAPANVRYVELGPGRGTLAHDALRVMRSAGSSHTPASEATRKWRSDVSSQRAGRRPLRSSMQAA